MKKLWIIFILSFGMFFLVSCTESKHPADDKYERRFSFDNYMNTLISIRVLADDEDQADQIQLESEKIYQMYHELTTNYEPLDENSEYLHNVYQINQNIGTKLEIDQELFDLIEYALEVNELTDGYFDISIGKIVDQWKSLIVPEETPEVGDSVFLTEHEVYAQIEAINQQNGEITVEGYTTPFYAWDFKQDISETAFNLTRSRVQAIYNNNFNILLAEEESKFYITLSGEDIKLDLGAISKGYATQKVYEYLQSLEIEYFSISAGTSSIVVGKNENRDEDYFWISLANPIVTTTSSDRYGTIYVKDASITTSGNYEQYVIYQGLRYHHIVSPKTKEPAHFYHTVTIIGQNAALLDALSTALFSMPKAELEVWINQHQTTLDIDIITYNQDHTISKYFIHEYNEDF